MKATGTASEVPVKLGDVRALLLDLDGTLVDLHAPWADLRRSLAAFLEPGILPTGPERPATETLRDLRAAGRDDDVDRVLELLERVESAGLDGSRVVPRGLALLEAAEERAIPVAVVSNNCQGTVDAALERHDLRPRVVLAVGLAATAHPKPQPTGVAEVLAALGVTPDEALFVGNDRKDFEAGRAAGVPTLDVASYELV